MATEWRECISLNTRWNVGLNASLKNSTTSQTRSVSKKKQHFN